MSNTQRPMSDPKEKAVRSEQFDTLYSGNKNGSVQQWTISVSGATITKVYGQVSGALQTTTDVVRKGKNLGRTNATTPVTQARAEAKSQWEKKLKSGYVRVLSDAQSGAVDTQFIEGGVEVMLAQKFSQHGGKIDYPAFVQPKLDGVRCIAILEGGVCTLWTRTRKPITGVPHIVEAIEQQFSGVRWPGRPSWQKIVLDGELYQHDYKDKFEQIVSFVRQSVPKIGHTVVEYHVYDVIEEGDMFAARTWTVEELSLRAPLVTVETTEVDSLDEVLSMDTTHRAAGYEGTIVRQATAMYEAGRSMGLQKIKQFDDAEFEVTGVRAGRGRMSECAIFTCSTKTGESFACKMEGALDTLKPYLTNPDTAIGKKLTVRYQGLTNGGVPRFPIGVGVRDYE
jgi:DNA ligase-1